MEDNGVDDDIEALLAVAADEDASRALSMFRVRVTSSWNFFTSSFFCILSPAVIFFEDPAAPWASSDVSASDDDVEVDGAGGGT